MAAYFAALFFAILRLGTGAGIFSAFFPNSRAIYYIRFPAQNLVPAILSGCLRYYRRGTMHRAPTKALPYVHRAFQSIAFFMGKIARDCTFFSRRKKRAGLKCQVIQHVSIRHKICIILVLPYAQEVFTLRDTRVMLIRIKDKSFKEALT